jgi:ATP-dependent Lhr-like helicase
MPLPQFHPAVQSWFASAFPGGATPGAARRVASDRERTHALIRRADRLGQDAGGVSRGHRLAGARGRGGQLRDVTRVVYVSPLKALSNESSAISSSRWPAFHPRC